jgi:hypothetical protein
VQVLALVLAWPGNSQGVAATWRFAQGVSTGWKSSDKKSWRPHRVSIFGFVNSTSRTANKFFRLFGHSTWTWAQHLPVEAMVVLRRINMDLSKPIRGAIRASATLGPEQSHALHVQVKGEIDVPVQIEDETGHIPASGTMRMAWFPRKNS